MRTLSNGSGYWDMPVSELAVRGCRLAGAGLLAFETGAGVCHVEGVNEHLDDDELQARRRWIIGGTMVAALLVLGVAAWLARPVYRHYKETRNLKQARVFLKQGDFRNGVLSLRATLAANPANLEATRLMADLLAEAQSPAAVGWWRRVVELSPTTANRVLFAATALRVEKPPFPLVTQALEEIKNAGGETNVGYHLVASQAALRLNRMEDAARHLSAAIQLEPTNRLHHLNLATLRLRDPDSPAATQARAELTALVADAALGEHALRSLIADGLVRRRFDDAEARSQQLLALPTARFDDRLQHLTVLEAAGRPATAAWLAQLQQEAATNVAKIIPTVGWMTARGQAAAATNWLATIDPQLRSTQPLPLVEADCFLALKDWPALETFLGGQNWEEQEPVRLTMLARAMREQGRREMGDAQWRRALGGNAKAESLGAVAQMTAAWGWAQESEEALWAIIKRAAWHDWAWQALIRARTAAADTAGLYRVYTALLESKPNAAVVKNNVAALGLLLGRDAEKCQRLAREVYLAATNNSTAASTHAFALHKQGKSAEGLSILQSQPEAELRRPGIATYHAVLLAANGRQAEALAFVDLAEKGPLLPEEKALLDAVRAGK